MPKLLSGAEIVFKSLEDQNVEFIFGYPGGAVLPIYDELKNQYLIGLKIQNQILLIMISRRFLLKYQEMNCSKKSLKGPTQCLCKNALMKLKNLTQ